MLAAFGEWNGAGMAERGGGVRLAAVLVLLLATCGHALAAGKPRRAELRVVISGVASDKGHVLVALHASAKTWYTDSDFASAKFRAYATRELRARTGGVTAVFRGLPPGRYAVTVIDDEDDNRRLDRWLYPFTGTPIERYGNSNNAWQLLGKPTFKDASIEVSAPVTEIHVRLSSQLSKALSPRPGSAAQ